MTTLVWKEASAWRQLGSYTRSGLALWHSTRPSKLCYAFVCSLGGLTSASLCLFPT